MGNERQLAAMLNAAWPPSAATVRDGGVRRQAAAHDDAALATHAAPRRTTHKHSTKPAY